MALLAAPNGVGGVEVLLNGLVYSSVGLAFSPAPFSAVLGLGMVSRGRYGFAHGLRRLWLANPGPAMPRLAGLPRAFFAAAIFMEFYREAWRSGHRRRVGQGNNGLAPMFPICAFAVLMDSRRWMVQRSKCGFAPPQPIDAEFIRSVYWRRSLQLLKWGGCCSNRKKPNLSPIDPHV